MRHLTDPEFYDAIGDPLLVFGVDGDLREWNRAAADRTGLAEEELDEAGLDRLFGADADGVAAAVRAAASDGHATVTASFDGDATEHELNLDRFAGAEGTAAVGGVARELTGGGCATPGRERTLRGMYEVIADETRSFDDQVRALLRLARTELGTEYGTLAEIRGDEHVFEVIDSEDDGIEFDGGTVEEGDVVPLSTTICAETASRQRSLVLGDVSRDAGAAGREAHTQRGVSCYVGAPVFVDDELYGVFCVYGTDSRREFSEWESTLVDLMSRWVSYELQRRRTTDLLKAQNDRLERLTETVSHDLRNPIAALSGHLALAERTGDEEQFERCREALRRMEALVGGLRELTRVEGVVDAETPVDLGALAGRCWQTVPTADATLTVETDGVVRADEGRLRQLLENLMRNAVEHGGTDVEVTVGSLSDGFYVEDDGAGLPDGAGETLFESGYSTDSGTGLGLTIVEEVAAAHGWTVEATAGGDGGARFEVRGVGTVE